MTIGNKLYDKGRNKILEGLVAWKNGGDTFRAYLIDYDGNGAAVYTTDFANDEFLSSIDAGNRAGYVAVVPGDPVAGVADAPDITFTGIAAGPACDCIVIVKWVTSAADSPLIVFIDTATGLPVTPNGGDLNVVWDNTGNKIFKL